MQSPPPDESARNAALRAGFTLIELSIVLVIIGLVVGGVLVGQDLIRAAHVRATITQIEKYNTAVNTFRGKYGALPGDIPAPSAAQFGFAARDGSLGCGDGNGILESAGSNGAQQGAGEKLMFWIDLSQSQLVEGTFTAGTLGTNCQSLGIPNLTDFSMFFPVAKIGQGNYVYVWSVNGVNYFALANVFTSGTHGWNLQAAMSLTVQQAYNIDQKIDDGYPQTGRITAQYIVWSSVQWAGVSPGTSVTGSATTCYDNGGSSSNQMSYSLSQSNGAGMNCALSFRFQ